MTRERSQFGSLRSRPACARNGMSLLEVLLAIAILGMSIATIGELVRIGTLAAANTRDLTAAQMLAETKMSEINSGLYPLSPVAQAVDEYDPQWTYSVEMQQIDQEGLVAVRIIVNQNLPASQRPVRFELVRWLREDDLLIEEETEDTEEETSSSSSSSSGSGSSSGGVSSGASGASSSGGGR